MIRINLTRGRKSTAGGSGFSLDISSILAKFKGGGGGGGGDFDFRKSHFVRAVALGVVCYLAMGVLEDKKKDELALVQAENAKIMAENQTIETRLNEIKGFESTKKALEDDEKSIRTKLEVIAKLMDNRDAPSRLMLQIAQNIPEEVWLNELNVGEEAVKFRGSTPGLPQVSELIGKLNESSMLSDISLSGTQEAMVADGNASSPSKEKRVQSFEINAKRRRL